MLTIDTNHPCGNLVHERELLNLTWGENGSLLSVTKSSEQTKKSRKITSLQLNHSSCFLKLPIGSGANHLNFQTGFSGFCACKGNVPPSLTKGQSSRGPSFSSSEPLGLICNEPVALLTKKLRALGTRMEVLAMANQFVIRLLLRKWGIGMALGIKTESEENRVASFTG